MLMIALTDTPLNEMPRQVTGRLSYDLHPNVMPTEIMSIQPMDRLPRHTKAFLAL